MSVVHVRLLNISYKSLTFIHVLEARVDAVTHGSIVRLSFHQLIVAYCRPEENQFFYAMV